MTGLREGELESAGAMALAIERGAVTALELVERAISRAEAWQPTINAFSQVWADEALAEARRTAAAPPEGLPFAGVPLVVKDLYDVAGHETTGCCAAYRGNGAV